MRKITLIIVFVVMVSIFWRPDSVFAKSKKYRIISLAPAVTEILFSLGLDDDIVGVTTFCDYPPKAKAKEKVGSFSQPSIERIIFLKPDIVFATGLEQASVVDKLRKVGLRVYVSDPENFKELFRSISKIAELTNKEKEASLLISQIEARIRQISDKVKLIPQENRLSVFIEIGIDPLMTAGKGSFVDELITLAGGINIAGDIPRSYSYFSSEQVLMRNPDCIILGYMDKEWDKAEVKSRLGWESLTAVKNDRIYSDIDPNLFFRPGPRLVEGLEAIYEKLYSR